MSKNWYTKHPGYSAIGTTVVAGVILIVIDRCVANIQLWNIVKDIPGYFVFRVPTPLLILAGLSLFTILFFVKLWKDRLARRCGGSWSITKDPIDGILWEYDISLTTAGEEIEIGRAICPRSGCKNELDMPEWCSNEAPLFGIKANCRKCGFSKEYPLYHLDGLKLLAEKEIERLERLK